MFKDKISWIILALIALVLTSYRATNYSEKEISWDILGYYLPLPATFIYNDPMLNDRTWVEKLNQEKNLSGTLYQISSNDEGKPMYFFLFGMALFYLPFFFIGHLWAQISDYPPDGFSFPYQYSLLIGGIIYTLIGLFYLRKILKHYFSESMTAILLVLVVFATNYIHHLTLKNIETVNILFTLVTIVLWNTIQWHRFHHLKNLLSIGIGITLMSLVKPSEIFILLIPLFWMVDSKATWIAKRQLIWQYRLQFVFVLFACVIIALPQMMYWYVKTGKLFYDSYKNPGVGLDILNPHIFEVLFSYRKGWLLYTPIMIFALIGFYFLYKKNRKLFLPLIIYFLSSFYIIASWTEWWYGAGFSNRPVITMYPILAIALGYFLVELQTKNYFLKIVVGVTCLWFLVLNQFQWWQFKNYILDATRVTKEYYWATFLKTYNTEEDKGLLLVARDYTGIHDFSNMDNYEVKDVRTIKIENEKLIAARHAIIYRYKTFRYVFLIQTLII